MKADNRNILYFGDVISVVDDQEGLRIKVKLKYYDNNKSVSEIPYAFPLLPKMIHVNPKIGETVLVVLQEQGSANDNRYFIGPIISQPYYMYDATDINATALVKASTGSTVLKKPSMLPDNRGTLPVREAVALEGRHNADVILMDNEVRLRCGFKKDIIPSSTENSLIFNNKCLAYIQMRFGTFRDNKNNKYNSVINIVADRINLMSHEENLNLADPKDLMTDQELGAIVSGDATHGSHPVVYGDELIAWIKQFINVFRAHTHPFAMDPPLIVGNSEKILSRDLDPMLSKTIHVS